MLGEQHPRGIYGKGREQTGKLLLGEEKGKQAR